MKDDESAPSANVLRTLRHTLGITRADDSEPYRNHYVAGPGHHNESALSEAVNLGLMEQVRAPGFLPGGSTVWRVTGKGRALALEHRAREVAAIPRGRKRYRRWLAISDCYDISFGDWLRNGGRP